MREKKSDDFEACAKCAEGGEGGERGGWGCVSPLPPQRARAGALLAAGVRRALASEPEKAAHLNSAKAP
jgi:hypothetical protein